MKKVLAVSLALVMAFCLFTACGSGTSYKLDISPYDQLDFSEYVKLPEKLDGYKFDVEEVKVTDEDVDKEIQGRLDKASTESKEITKGKVKKGDTVNISFKGTLKDGSSPDEMNSEGTEIVLGEAGFIEGFEEGLYGATIGKPVTLKLQFPDPYTMNEELSGKDVTFEVTVLSKKEIIKKELDDDFIKSDSDGKASDEKEYREYIKSTLQEYADNQAVYQAKQKLLSEVMGDCEIVKYPEEEVENAKTKLIEQYKSYAEANQVEWADFLESQFGGEDTFNEELDSYVKEVVVGNNLMIYGLCKQAGIEIGDKEYNEYIEGIFEDFDVKDAEEFQTKTGMSFDNYITAYDVPLNMFADKLLDKLSGKEDK